MRWVIEVLPAAAYMMNAEGRITTKLRLRHGVAAPWRCSRRDRIRNAAREKPGGAFPLENLTNSWLGALGLYVAIVIAYLLAA